MSRLISAAPIQNGYVVRDVRRAIDYWTSVLGVGPFFLIEHVVMDEYEAYDEPASIDVSVALAMTGSMQIELIQQHNDTTTPYSHFMDEFGEGMQHIGYFTWDYDADRKRLEDAGLTAVHRGEGKGARFVYFDDGGHAGTTLELSEMTSGKQAFFDLMTEAARDWDGREPVRIRG